MSGDESVAERRRRAAARRVFIGRERELDAFRANLAPGVPPTMIFAVTGEPGVGKTTLLRRMRAEVRTTTVTAWVDGPGYHPVTVIERLADALRPWVDTADLDDALAVQARDLRRFEPFGAVPVDGPRDARRRGVHRLTPLAIDAVNRSIERGLPVMLFLDDMGWPSDDVARWLVEIMAGTYGEFYPEFLVVLAGDASCTGPLVRYPFAVTPLGLGRFLPEETEAFLHARGIDPDRAGDVHLDSGGLPAFVDLLAHPAAARRRTAQGPPDPIAHLLETLPEGGLAAGVLRTGVPRWLDAGVLAAVHRGRTRSAVRSWLRSAPAAHAPGRHAPGRHWHPVVRSALLAHLRAHDPEGLRAVHARVARYHEGRWADLGGAGPAALRHRREADHHRVACADEALTAATVVAARVLGQGAPAVPTVVAIHQALAERGVADGRFASLAAALANDDLTATAWSAGQLDAPSLPAGTRRRLVLSQWAASPRRDAEGWRPPDGDAPWLLGAAAVAAWHGGRDDEALELADAALAGAPDDAWLLGLRGDERLRRGDLDGALADLRAAASFDPELGWVHARLGVVALGLDQYDAAVDHLGLAAGLDPDDAVVLALRGEAHRRRGDADAALTDLDRAVLADPGCAWIRVALARVLGERGDHAGASEQLVEAGALAPRSAQVIAARAEARRRSGDHRGALDDATRALALADDGGEDGDRLAPVDGPPGSLAGLYEWLVVPELDRLSLLLGRAAVRRSRGDGEGAEDDLNEVLAMAPDHVEALDARARVRMLRDDLVGARADLDRCVALGRDGPEQQTVRGTLCLAMGDAVGAVAAFTRAIEADPTNGDTFALRGAARRAMGDSTGTVRDLSTAVALGCDTHWVFAQRGEAHLALGQVAEARADVAAAMARGGEDADWVRSLRERVRAASPLRVVPDDAEPEREVRLDAALDDVRTDLGADGEHESPDSGRLDAR